MELKGTLDHQSLQEIFTTLARNKAIGTLIISDGESKKFIYFARAGVRLLSSGRRKAVPLGDLLMKRNKITNDQLQAVLERQKETGEMIGKILTDWGLVTEEEIDEAVRSQIEEEIFDIFAWENASFEFTEGAPPKELFDPNQRATRLTFDVFQLVEEANQRVHDMHEIKKILPALDAVYALGEFTELEYYEKDDADPTKRVVLLIDGVRTIGEILDEVDVPRIEVARILDELVTQKKIEKLARAAAGAEVDEEGKSDLETFILKCEREIFNDPDNYNLRERLAQAYYDMGDLEKAVLHLNLVSKAQLKAGQIEKALTTTRRVAEVVPEDPEIRERLLHIHLEMRQISEALEEASILARLYTEEGEVEKVRNMYKLVLELVPDDIDIRKKLINVHIDLGDRDAAAQEYEEIARVVTERGERHKLEEIYRKILRLAPHRGDIKKKLGGMKTRPTIHIPRGRLNILRRLFRWVIVLAVLGGIGYAVYHEFDARQRAKPNIARARTLMGEGKFDDARALLRSVKQAHPYTVMAYLDIENHLKEVNGAEKRAKQEVEERQAREIKRDRQDFEGIVEKEESVLSDMTMEETDRYDRLLNLYAAMKKLAETSRDNEWVAKAGRWVRKWEENHKRAEELLAQARKLESEGRIEEGRALRMKIREATFHTDTALGLDYPFRIVSEPSKADVFIKGEKKGTTPLLLYLPIDYTEKVDIRLVKDGYSPLEDYIWDIKAQAVFKYFLRRKPLWQIQTDATIQSAPVLDGKTLYFGSRDGYLYAVKLDAINPQDPATWFPAWKYKSPERPEKLWEILASPVVRNGVAYYGSTDTHLYAVKDNRELWNFKAGGILENAPVLAGSLLLIGCNVARSGRVYALEIQEAEGRAVTRWQFPRDRVRIRRAVTSPAVYPEGKVAFLGDAWGDIHVIDLSTGRRLGFFNTKMSIESSFLVFDHTLFFVGSDKSLHAYDVSKVREGGKARSMWSFPLKSLPKVPPVQFGGWLVVTTEDGHVTVLDVRTKGTFSKRWSYKVEGKIYASPRLSNQVLLVGSFNKTLYGINMVSGKLSWRFDTPGSIRGIAVDTSSGIIYTTCEEGIVFALREK
jgi:outer membrane protein assembly factor BamB/tetratricopeptide (TPR) repeat protein